jgi:DNA mismatch repair protein PMS2
VSSVFGSSFLSTLVPISLEVTVGALAVIDRDCDVVVEDSGPSGQIQDEHENVDSNIQGSVVAVIKGLVSKAGAGVGRSDNDRQFIFCNGRPVDLPRFTKVMNEVWRRYEMKHKPAFIINIDVPAGAFDVNLSPDKREIVLTNESLILENLAESVDKIYAPTRYTFTVDQSRTCTENHLLQSNLLSYGTITKSPAEGQLALDGKLQNEVDNEKELVGIEEDKLAVDDKNPMTMMMTNTPSSSQQHTSSHPLAAPVWSTQLESGRLFDCSATSVSVTGNTSSGSISFNNNKGSKKHGTLKPTRFIWKENVLPESKGSSDRTSEYTRLYNPKILMKSFIDEEFARDMSTFSENAEVKLSQPSGESQSTEVEFVGSKRDREPDEEGDAYVAYTQGSSSESSVDRTWHFDTSKVVSAFTTRYNITEDNSSSSLDYGKSVKGVGEDGSIPSEVFLDVSISDPSVRIINKRDFERMQVIGQFNLGFMIALLDEDLYILDQHACDEKYR